MADGQEWLFAKPPAPGAQAQYDALVHCLLEAEDQNEARKSELAIAIYLLSSYNQLSPREYEEIFSFGSDDAARSSAQEAISALICQGLGQERRHAAPARPASTALRSMWRNLNALFSSFATHFRSSMGPWRH
jgi:hypothetical protein